YIRHGSHPEFTPEPDMIHDCLGHCPPLMNRDYAELLTLIGKAVATTTKGDQVLALKRFSWFSIEFGLIAERGETKVFGAGILSSTGEIPFCKIDHVRFFVGNARQSAYFYRNAYGFDVVGYAGLETKMKHEAGYVLKQGGITFVLTSPLRASHPDVQRLVLHGDGVSDIALQVDDVREAYNLAVLRGAVGVKGPTLLEDEYGVYEYATIRAYGDTTHTFVNRDRYKGVFAPGFTEIDPTRYSPGTYHPAGLLAIDHVVGNVEEGKMDEWVEFYRRVLGFEQLVSFDDKDISTEYSALMSKVVQGGRGRIKFP